MIKVLSMIYGLHPPEETMVDYLLDKGANPDGIGSRKDPPIFPG